MRDVTLEDVTVAKVNGEARRYENTEGVRETGVHILEPAAKIRPRD